MHTNSTFDLAARVRPYSRWETLEAIHQVENPHNVRTPGAHGELGPYQMLGDTWGRYTTLTFNEENACDPELAVAVALKHVRHLEAKLVEYGWPVNAHNIAVLWNAGENVNLLTIPASTLDYAKRVAALCK